MKLIFRLLILIISTIATLSILASLVIDRDVLKNNIQVSIDRVSSGEFLIAGDVEIDFFPTPFVQMRNVSFKKVPYGDNFADVLVNNLGVKVDILSLLQNKIKLDSLILRSPSLVLYPSALELSDIKNDDRSVSDEVPEQKDQEKEQQIEDKIDVANQDREDPKILQESDESEVSVEQKQLVYDQTKLVSKIFDLDNVDEAILDLSLVGVIELYNGSFKRLGLGGETIMDLKEIAFVRENNISDQKFSVNGSLLAGKTPTQFDLLMNAQSDSNSTLTINSPIFKLDLEGKFIDSDIGNLIRSSFSGLLSVDIVKPSEFFDKYFSKYSIIYGKVETDKSIKFSMDINSIKGDYNISNIQFNSAVLNGSGLIKANLSSRDAIIDANFDMDYVNVDGVWSPRFIGHSASIVEYERNILDNFISGSDQQIITDDNELESLNKDSLFDSLQMQNAIKIKKATYLGQFIEDIDIAISADDFSVFNLDKMNMTTPDGANMSFSGSLQSTKNIPEFSGRYDIKGGNFVKFLNWLGVKSDYLNLQSEVSYNIGGDVMFLPNFYAIKNLNIGIGKDTNINGNVRYDRSKDVQIANFNLNLDRLDLSKDFNMANIKNNYLDSGSLFKKLLWLKAISKKNNINLKINELLYKDYIFDNQQINFLIAPGALELKQSKFKSRSGLLDNDVYFGVMLGDNPELKIALQTPKFSYKNSQADNIDFSQRLFSLPSLLDFSGQILLRAGQFQVNNFQAENLNITGNLKNGVWDVKDSSVDIYGGNISYNGQILFDKAKSVALSFSALDIDNKEMLGGMFNLNSIGGSLNSSGAISSDGSNYQEFIQSIRARLKFIAGNVNVAGLGLNELARRMSLANYYKVNLGRPEYILFNKNYNTVFKDVAGSFQIDPVKNLNELIINSSYPGVNSVVTGSVNLLEKSFSGKADTIFLVGTRKKQEPINIAVNYGGKIGNLRANANLEQVAVYAKKMEQKYKNK